MVRVALLAGLSMFTVAGSPAATAQQDVNSGNFWTTQCRGETPTSLCVGYLGGFIDMNWVLVASNDNPLWCPPEEVTLEQVRKVVLAHMEARPQNLHEPFAMLAASALRKAFPCAARDKK